MTDTQSTGEVLEEGGCNKIEISIIPGFPWSDRGKL
jgi:hypothetical protein